MQRLMAQGFDTFKLNGCEEMPMLASNRAVDAAVAVAAGVRGALGQQVDFGLDFHGRVAMPMAKVLLRELEPLRPLFVEEPVLAEQAEYYARLADATPIPLAAGERMYSRFEFKRVLAGGGIAILQPDLSHAGGITECHKIAAMAEAHDVSLAPHCPLGPVALAACLQIDLVAHNAVLQEQSMGIHYHQGDQGNQGHQAVELLDYVVNKDDFRIEAGYIQALRKPGLGVEIDEERVRYASRHAPDWHNPLWRHADGSVAEW
jgi:galactonate dehydratase